MNTAAVKNFPVKPVVAAVALALSAVSAYAGPVTPNQMPGAGNYIAGSPGTLVQAVAPNAGGTCTAVCAPGAGSTIINLVSAPLGTPQIIFGGVANPRAVIQWGGAGNPALPPVRF